MGGTLAHSPADSGSPTAKMATYASTRSTRREQNNERRECLCRRGRRLARPHRADDDGGLGSGDRRRSAVFAPRDAEGLSTRQATPRRAVPLSREPEAMWPRVFSVELRGLEPLTPTLPVSQSMSGWCGHVVGSLAHQHVSSGTSGACRGVVERLGPMVAHRPARCAATLTVSVGADWTTHAAPVLIDHSTVIVWSIPQADSPKNCTWLNASPRHSGHRRAGSAGPRLEERGIGQFGRYPAADPHRVSRPE